MAAKKDLLAEASSSAARYGLRLYEADQLTQCVNKEEDLKALLCARSSFVIIDAPLTEKWTFSPRGLRGLLSGTDIVEVVGMSFVITRNHIISLLE